MIAAARRLFDGIAARIGWTVILALLLTQAVSAVVFYVDSQTVDPPVHNLGNWAQRIAAIAQLVEATAPEHRPAVIRALDDSFLRVEWTPVRPAMAEAGDDFPAGFLKRRMRRAMGDFDRPMLIEFQGGFADALARRGGRNGMMPPPAPDAEGRAVDRLRVAVRLADSSWLIVSSGNPVKAYTRVLLGLLWMGGIAATVMLLSVWAARRLASPIDRFAQAAGRLGIDPEARPIEETGPRELRTAIRAFNGMQERLRRFVADRTQMLAAISHDLRTPLTRLRLRAELVDDPEMQRKMLADLDEMQAMISASLEFARDDAKREPRGPLDLADLLQSLCDDRVDAGHEAAYDGPAHLRIDGRPVALRRAFANLMDNAIAYGARVRVRLEPGGDHVRIVVDDDGPGIPEAEREKVFQPFYRIETSRSRDTGGVGLGLSTARTVIHGHGGGIELANRPEGGLRVTVTLPA
jgi:signal transduction histidine kinase